MLALTQKVGFDNIKLCRTAFMVWNHCYTLFERIKGVLVGFYGSRRSNFPKMLKSWIFALFQNRSLQLHQIEVIWKSVPIFALIT